MAPAVILMAVSLAATAAQTAMSIKAQKDQQKAREQAAARQRQELERQQRRENIIAQEKKADVRNRADRAIGTMLAGAADNGSTAAAVTRLAGDIGGVSGTDLARIESNRGEGMERRRSEWLNINGQLSAHAKQTNYSIMGTAFAGVGKMASTGFSYYSGASDATKTTPLTPGVQGPSVNSAGPAYYGSTNWGPT